MAASRRRTAAFRASATLLPHPPTPPPHPSHPQDKHPGVTIASLDTTEEPLEGVVAELGIKGLPQFRFFKVGWEWVGGWVARPDALPTPVRLTPPAPCPAPGRQGGAAQADGLHEAAAERRGGAAGGDVTRLALALARAPPFAPPAPLCAALGVPFTARAV